ncbi:MAG: hypothetical protein KDE27_01430, partial [Planctomycetes bacterium]|nr:hypothetical protein [Planctomycetota bacterium]
GVEQSIQPAVGVDGRIVGAPNGQFANDGYRVTDAAGEFAPGCDPAFPIAIGALLPVAQRTEFHTRLGVTPNPLALVFSGKAAAGGRIDARVDRLQPLRCRILRPDGSPAQRAHVRLAAGDNPGIGLGYVADQRGEVVVLVPAVDDLVLAASLDDRGDVFRIAVPAIDGPAAIVDLVLELPEAVTLCGTIRNGSEAAAGAEVTLGASLRGPRFGWVPVEATNTAGPHVVSRGYYYPPMALPMFRRSTVTDEDGRFELRLPSFAFPLEAKVDGRGPYWLGDLTRGGGPEAEVELAVR